jgi:hypothetical protein
VHKQHLGGFSRKALFLQLVRIPTYFLILWQIFLNWG